jgi:hypothetical protein
MSLELNATIELEVIRLTKELEREFSALQFAQDLAFTEAQVKFTPKLLMMKKA